MTPTGNRTSTVAATPPRANLRPPHSQHASSPVLPPKPPNIRAQAPHDHVSSPSPRPAEHCANRQLVKEQLMASATPDMGIELKAIALFHSRQKSCQAVIKRRVLSLQQQVWPNQLLLPHLMAANYGRQGCTCAAPRGLDADERNHALVVSPALISPIPSGMKPRDTSCRRRYIKFAYSKRFALT